MSVSLFKIESLKEVHERQFKKVHEPPPRSWKFKNSHLDTWVHERLRFAKFMNCIDSSPTRISKLKQPVQDSWSSSWTVQELCIGYYSKSSRSCKRFCKVTQRFMNFVGPIMKVQELSVTASPVQESSWTVEELYLSSWTVHEVSENSYEL